MTGEGLRDLFQIATREALRPQLNLFKPSKGFNLFKGRFNTPRKDIDQVTESQSVPPLDAAEEKELKGLLIAATAAAPQALTQFRLLIIGKTGCGKTTILSKVYIYPNFSLQPLVNSPTCSRCAAVIW
jgi:predicted ATPase with chaperone activity